MNPLVLALGGLVLFLAGLGLGFLMSRRPGDREAADELAAVRQDFEAYREGVTEHFRDSATHFQAIGEQYRALYAHMADGAKNFCAAGSEQEAIEFAPQPELAAPEAEGGRKPLTAAAAAAALSETPTDDDTAEIADRPEPGLEPDEGESAAAEEERDETPDAGTDEPETKASDEVASDEEEREEPQGDEQVPGPEHKEPQSAGSRMVH